MSNDGDTTAAALDAKIAKLQAAADDAELQVKVCRDALDLANRELATAKAKYRNLTPEEQAVTTMDQTELPELIETQLRAQNVFETVQARHETNVRYLNMLKSKRNGN